jgi:hypothetical protein
MDVLGGLLDAIEDAGGFVTVNGRVFVRRSVLRDVLLVTSRQLCVEILDRLMPMIGGHDAEERLQAEVDNIAPELEKKISEILPVLN